MEVGNGISHFGIVSAQIHPLGKYCRSFGNWDFIIKVKFSLFWKMHFFFSFFFCTLRTAFMEMRSDTGLVITVRPYDNRGNILVP